MNSSTAFSSCDDCFTTAVALPAPEAPDFQQLTSVACWLNGQPATSSDSLLTSGIAPEFDEILARWGRLDRSSLIRAFRNQQQTTTTPTFNQLAWKRLRLHSSAEESRSHLRIAYGCGQTPFGSALLAWSQVGICHLEFLDGNALEDSFDELRQLQRQWAGARFLYDQDQADERLQNLFSVTTEEPEIVLHVQASDFRLKVWRALCRLPYGRSATYSDLAAAIGQPEAARAVGSAVAANPVGWLIPCHRIAPRSGGVGGFRWGQNRKLLMRIYEQAVKV